LCFPGNLGTKILTSGFFQAGSLEEFFMKLILLATTIAVMIAATLAANLLPSGHGAFPKPYDMTSR
jgi:hypothetical protein